MATQKRNKKYIRLRLAERRLLHCDKRFKVFGLQSIKKTASLAMFAFNIYFVDTC